MAYISIMSFKAPGLQCDLRIHYTQDYFFSQHWSEATYLWQLFKFYIANPASSLKQVITIVCTWNTREPAFSPKKEVVQGSKANALILLQKPPWDA